MKTGLSLTELAAEIERRAASKKDYLAPVGKLGFVATEDSVQLQVGKSVLPLNDLAHGQIAEYTGIPKAYYDRCRTAAPSLLAGQVNRWLIDKNDDRRMVRTLDGTVRAFLSDRYRPLDYEDLAQAVLPVLLEMNLMILSSQITETRLYIKAVDRSITKAVPSGRKMGDGSHVFFRTQCPGITISDSEVGMGRLLIETSMFDEFCTNLAAFGTSLKKQHVGGRMDLGDDVYAILTDETKKLTDAALWGQVRDVVSGAFDRVQFEARCEKMAGAAEDKIEGDVVELVNRFAKRNAVGEGTRDSILRHLIEGADLTRFGLHSAVTRASADVESYDDATELERLGGNIIELPRGEWQELLKAA